jgi:regulator of sirC expression with transglutaminase-like and TPR domain
LRREISALYFTIVKNEQTSALVKLLQEGDPATTDLVREQLCRSGEDWEDDLNNMATMDDPQVAEFARGVLGQLHQTQAENDFDLLCRFFAEEGNLEEACWALCGLLDPKADVPAARRILNTWGRELLLKVSSAISTRERVQILARFLNDNLNLRGNSEDYYNSSNSLLTAVIETRKGLPITLSCLIIFLAHRAGMNVVGINLPGHFIVRHGEIFFDPFHQSRILSREDCEEILRCQGIEPTPECFAVATPRRILQRILCNLHFVFDKKEESQMAGKCRCWLEALRRAA